MKILVTGAGGFLGAAVTKLLRQRGDAVVGYNRGRSAALEALGVAQVQGDVSDAGRLTAAAAGCDAVIHVAAKAGVWGPLADYHRVNVTGTANVIEACRANGISRLVYTSTPSVVYHGGDIDGGDESLPYPAGFENAYARTKADAERLVLGANGPRLATVALRPHLIWGPGDNHLLPRLVDRAKSGRLRKLSGPPKLCDSVYVDNAADAHLLALDRLVPGGAVAGKPFFITNGEPLPVWDLINRLLGAYGVGPVEREVSPRLAYAAGAVFEGVYGLLRLTSEPPMTRFVARQLSTAHWFRIDAARRELGYEPRVSIAAGLGRLAASVRG